MSRRHGQALFSLAKSAKLRLAPSGQLATLLEPNADRMVLLVGRGDLRKLLKSADLKALRKAGSPHSDAPRNGASSWLLHDGRLLASERRADAHLTLASGDTGVPFSVACDGDECEASLGNRASDGGARWPVGAGLVGKRGATTAEHTAGGERGSHESR